MNKNLDQVLAELEAGGRTTSGKRLKTRTYSISLGGDTKAKLAPQGRAILTAVLKSGKSEISESELNELLNTDVVKGALNTKQDPWVIWQFHRKTICDAGWMKEVTGTPAPKAE